MAGGRRLDGAILRPESRPVGPVLSDVQPRRRQTATPATISTISISRKASLKKLSSWFRTALKVLRMSPGYLAMIPVKMIRDMPLPIPLSEICSPSHIRNTVPEVSVMIVRKRKASPGFGTMADVVTKPVASMFSRKIEMP